MPFRTNRFEHVQGVSHIFAGSSSYGKFHNNNGKSNGKQKEKINCEEVCSAIEPGNIRKTPYVSEAYGTAG